MAKEKYKYIILVRHGEPDNPKNIVYNLDEVMEKEDMIHITDYGKRQLKALGKVIKKENFKVVKIRYSNQTRAVESTLALNEILKVKNIKKESKLKDVFAPGVYLEGLTMHQWKDQKGNAYDKVRWRKYNHEKPQRIIQRIDEVFWESVKNLEVDQTAVLISHGDPIAWWINHQVVGKIPNPKQLRDLIYPNQGQGIVVVLNSKNEIVKHYLLKDPNLLKGKSY